jgi:GR25 family glycosyltransferase involved in LPS biosynthesis
MKYILVLLTIALVLYFIARVYRGALVSAHVINLDRSVDRLTAFKANASSVGLDVTRWAGVNGKTLGPADVLKQGVPRDIYEKHAAKKRLGVIGCYLSHATLLRHLESVPCGAGDYHLLFEDDAQLPQDFLTRLQGAIARLPVDWDILQLYNNRPATRPWSGNIHTLKPGNGNYGTVAYAVRHGALPKINAHVAVMRVPIDNQLLEKSQDWKWFCIVPDLVKTGDGGATTLND